MLFSKPEIAEFINRNFEPAWESVRPVPIVRIDFGNGNMLTRTLHGNIATYVCTAEGQVLDIAPGIYSPPAYRQRLDQFRLLANFVGQQGTDQREARLKEYHQAQLAALAKNEAPPMFVNMDMSKAKIEGRLKAVLVSGEPPKPAPDDDGVNFTAKDELANWNLLAEDTRLNETARRRQIHELLAGRGLVEPSALTRHVYKNILHADLDDPHLGLGAVLFAGYPFDE